MENIKFALFSRLEMNSSYNTRKLLIILQVISTSWFVLCETQKNKYRWNDDDNYDNIKNIDDDLQVLDKGSCLSSNTLEDCEDERDSLAYNIQYNKRQPLLNSAFTSTIGDKSIRTAPLFHSNQLLSCSCELERRMIYLGLDYYPRYVSSVECKPGGCYGGYRCHAKKYKIHVLKKKQIEDEVRTDKSLPGFPETLRDLYLSEPMHVTVACECAP